MPNLSPALNPNLRFGTQLFVNPEDSPELLRERLRTLRESGFELIRLFLPWSQLEPTPGTMRWSPFSEIFDEASVLGMKIVATLMSVSPPGWMGLTHGLQDVAGLDDPEFFEKSLAHVRAVVERLKGHPALDSWILWNEPSRELRPSDSATWLQFQKYLEQTYKGNIEEYNASHFQPANSFAEITPPKADAYAIGFGSHRAKVEWLEFTVANLQEKVEAIAREVRALDSEHPIHVNPHRVSQCLADVGQSIWKEAELVDFIGCSSHPAWHSVRFPRRRYGESVAMFADLMRSATLAKDDYFWVTELQGGGTLLSAFQPLAPAPDEARLWLWQSIAAGAKAVIYWCANGRTDGYEAGEWDLLDYSGRPSPVLREIRKTIADVGLHLPAFARASPAPAHVGILVSEESMILDFVEGEGEQVSNPRNKQKGADAMCGAYLMAADLSLETVFYDQKRFNETRVEHLPPIILVPNLVVVEARTIASLKAAVSRGCTVIADGFFAWKDKSGRLAKPLWPAAAELWGAACSGYEAIDDSRYFIVGNSATHRGWYARTLYGDVSAEVLGSWEKGVPGLLCNRLGGGAAYRIGTHFFQHYLSSYDPDALKLFTRLIGDKVTGTHLMNPSTSLRLRRLRLDNNGELCVLINSSAQSEFARIQRANGEEVNATVPPRNALVLELAGL